MAASRTPFFIFGVCVSACALLATGSATAQAIVSGSPDITIELGAGPVTADEDVAVDNQMGVVLNEMLGPLPEASAINAFGLDVNGDFLISFETTTDLPGSVIARPGDIIRYNGANYSIEFDGLASGLPSGVRVDATSLAPGGLLLSFDTTVDLGSGLIVADEDLVRWNGSAFSLAFDGSAAGLDTALDIDAAQNLGGGVFLMSFDTTGQISGIVFDDEDVMRFDGAIWSLEFDGSAADPDWAAADLDAVMVVMVPEAQSGIMLSAGLLWLTWLGSRAGRARQS